MVVRSLHAVGRSPPGGGLLTTTRLSAHDHAVVCSPPRGCLVTTSRSCAHHARWSAHDHAVVWSLPRGGLLTTSRWSARHQAVVWSRPAVVCSPAAVVWSRPCGDLLATRRWSGHVSRWSAHAAWHAVRPRRRRRFVHADAAHFVAVACSPRAVVSRSRPTDIFGASGFTAGVAGVVLGSRRSRRPPCASEAERAAPDRARASKGRCP
jgi:hypothetical protein